MVCKTSGSEREIDRRSAVAGLYVVQKRYCLNKKEAPRRSLWTGELLGQVEKAASDELYT